MTFVTCSNFGFAYNYSQAGRNKADGGFPKVPAIPDRQEIIWGIRDAKLVSDIGHK